MTLLKPLPSRPGMPGFDYVDLSYPVANVAIRQPMMTFTYPPRHALTAHERAMLAAVSTFNCRSMVFNHPLVSALEGQEAAVLGGCDCIVDLLARNTLGIPNPEAGNWREAISNALLSDWIPLLGQKDAERLVPQRLKSEAQRAHRQMQPLWERKVNGRRVDLLHTPVGDGFTLEDVIADNTEPDQEILSPMIDEPRIREVLAALEPNEREVALAYARNPSVRTWTEAAQYIGVPHPDQFGERVRRKLKRLGNQREKRAAASQGAQGRVGE